MWACVFVCVLARPKKIYSQGGSNSNHNRNVFILHIKPNAAATTNTHTHTHMYSGVCVCVCCYLLRICNYTRQHSDSSLLASKAAWSILKAYVQQFSFFINYNSLPLSLSLFGREGLRRTRVHMIRTLFKCSTNFQSTSDTE